MKEKIPSFNLIYRPTCCDIRLQSNEGKPSKTRAPVLSNLKPMIVPDLAINLLHYNCCFHTEHNSSFGV